LARTEKCPRCHVEPGWDGAICRNCGLNYKTTKLAREKWALNDRAQLHNDANKVLDAELAPDEKVRVIIRGVFHSAMIGTDGRVLVYKKSALQKGDLATFDYDQVAEVILHTALVVGYVALAGRHLETTNLGINTGQQNPRQLPNAIAFNAEKDTVRHGVTVLRALIAEARASRQSASAGLDIPDQLRKLAELRDAGIVTNEEF
jgi:hypothetical protein